jgi:Flp pilus assembly secretin CpaC
MLTIKALSGAGGSSRVRSSDSKISNQLIVRSGESAVLGGLVTNDTAKDVDKDPEGGATGAGSPLFTLLRSKAFRNKKTQFVIFISPQIIADAAIGTQDIKAKIINNNKQRKRALK